LKFIESKFGSKKSTHGKSSGKVPTKEQEFNEAINDFGKNICFIFFELAVIVSIVLTFGHFFGAFSLFTSDDKL
jgi:hypothetical protein